MGESPRDEQAVFLAALEYQPGDSREAYLTAACGEDLGMLDRIRELLASHDGSVGPLDQPPPGLGLPPTLNQPLTEQPGTQIGPYKLLQQIGEGGFGVVYLAEQTEPVRRKVALKVIKPGMDTREVVARFEAERQALAYLDHPNIAKVLDGGATESGRPFFVMELVKGVPFTEYCDQARLPLAERLQLFIPVCQAVQHAHHKGIVHRDLKPSNILICLYDGQPIPKVIDFGLAKALQQPLTDKTLFTRLGMMVGTPLYMSPEQAEYNNLDVDTRTDIYALGVILYETLTGTTPLERAQIADAAHHEVLRLIKEVEPVRPSLRLSSGNTLPSVAAQRNIEPRQLEQSLAGELDWVVMKALEKERGRRYDTANDLIRDIEHFLQDQPVEARPPSASYRLHKFVRRHKRQLAAVAVVVVVLLAGIVGTSWGLIAARRARNVAISSEARAIDALKQMTRERDAKTAALAAEAAQREATERELIAGILRPIGYGSITESLRDVPSDGELRSLLRWSRLPDARLRMLVLEQAFEDPDTAIRVALRAGRSMQACVGMNPERRHDALKFLNERQQDSGADVRIRVAACWLAVELGAKELPALSETLHWLPGTDARDISSAAFHEFTLLFRSRATPETRILAADALVDLIGRAPTHGYNRHDVVEYIRSAAPFMSTAQAKRFWGATMAILRQENRLGGEIVRGEYRVLVHLAPRLAERDVGRASDELIEFLRTSVLDERIKHTACALAALAPRMPPSLSSRTIDALIEVLERSTDDDAIEGPAVALLEMISELDTPQETRAWNALIGAFQKVNAWPALDPASEAIIKLAPRIEEHDFDKGVDTLLQILSRSYGDAYNGCATNALIRLAPRLDSTQAERAATVLIDSFRATDHSSESEIYPQGGRILAALAPQLSLEQLELAFGVLIATVETGADVDWVSSATSAMVHLAPHVSSQHIARAWGLLFEDLEKGERIGAIAGLSRHVPTENAVGAGNVLITFITRVRTRDEARVPDTSESLREDALLAGQAFAAMSARLPKEQVLRAWDEMVLALTDSPRTRAASRGFRDDAAKVLVGLAPHLDAGDVPAAVKVLVEQLGRTEDPSWREELRLVLAALAPAMTTEQLTRVLNLVSGEERLSTYLESSVSEIVTTAIQRTPTAANETSVCLLRRVLDSTTVSSPKDWGEDFSRLASAATDAKAIAALLAHPSCVDGWRDVLLARFEELVMLGGSDVLLSGSHEDETYMDRLREDPPGQLRQFHTVHDAALWIRSNWPDFEL